MNLGFLTPPPFYCNSLKPGEVDFPMRCNKPRQHVGPHSLHVQVSNIAINEEWEDDDDRL